jgi:transcriptional regulator with XRE-family HTH domain
MARVAPRVLPAVNRVLKVMGENIRLARKRRRFSAALVAKRAGISVPTLRAIEEGSPSVTLGLVANVLQSLGLEKDLSQVARDDVLGRKLQDLALDPDSRAPGKRDR